MPSASVSLRISIVNVEEALQKSHKFLIQAVPSNDISKANWAGPGLEEHKIPAKIQSEAIPVSEESMRGSIYSDIEPAVKAQIAERNSVPIPAIQTEYSSPEKLKKADTVFDGKNDNQDKTKKLLSSRVNELMAIIANLKGEVDKANHKAVFSRELEKATYDSVGKYGLFHLVAAFFAAFILGYYVIG